MSPLNLTINQSDLASFNCSVFSIPLPSILWFFNGSSEALSDSDSSLEVEEYNFTNSSGQEITVSFLTIISDRNSHEGLYTCRASNDVDNIIGTPESANAFLTVQGMA